MASLLMLEIITGYTRPVMSLEINKTNFCNDAATGMADGIDNVTCLIDTGADTPVWTQGEERLQLAYKAEKIKDKKFILSGFGLGYEIVDVYEVHDLELIIGQVKLKNSVNVFKKTWCYTPKDGIKRFLKTDCRYVILNTEKGKSHRSGSTHNINELPHKRQAVTSANSGGYFFPL